MLGGGKERVGAGGASRGTQAAACPSRGRSSHWLLAGGEDSWGGGEGGSGPWAEGEGWLVPRSSRERRPAVELCSCSSSGEGSSAVLYLRVTPVTSRRLPLHPAAGWRLPRVSRKPGGGGPPQISPLFSLFRAREGGGAGGLRGSSEVYFPLGGI